MYQSLQKLITCLQQRLARRPALAPRGARLGIEALEAREVLSISPMRLPTAVLTPALVGSPSHHADSTGGTLGPIETPDQPVYGYKHRRRYPVTVNTRSPQVTPTKHRPGHFALPTQTLFQRGEVFSHLAVGGTDGSTVLSSNGLIVLHQPEGPLPTDALAAVG
jgi:hypothetical protein